ncbi:chemotaxis protein [Fusobacterium mortiferum]|uniref:Chemotaxis protein n=1 Tax=Fusobacterium mortiferum TaxID=850 RepID=A0ABS2FYG6_FUSMR|nr:chemotaxis protein [Fusobacterium mortiferum]MBM6874194.1 chemotaxis protein [Fusobacterium mortiferum]
MELYIDNKKVELKQKRFKSFGRMINEITKQLTQDNKVPYKFYINGEKLKDNTVVNLKDLKLVEVITKTEGEMLLDSIMRAKEQIDIFFSIFDSEDDEEENSGKTAVMVSEIEIVERGIFLRWFYNLLLLIKASGDLEFVYSDFDEYIAEFEREMEQAEKAYDAHDYETFVEMLEFSIGDLLQDFYENAENYYSDILEEENRKRLLN